LQKNINESNDGFEEKKCKIDFAEDVTPHSLID
jgi:hypothetical protein